MYYIQHIGPSGPHAHRPPCALKFFLPSERTYIYALGFLQRVANLCHGVGTMVCEGPANNGLDHVGSRVLSQGFPNRFPVIIPSVTLEEHVKGVILWGPTIQTARGWQFSDLVEVGDVPSPHGLVDHPPGKRVESVPDVNEDQGT